MVETAEIPGAVIAGSYHLERPLDGLGGRVHEARHDRLTGRFAVKWFTDADPGAFQRGAQLASALRHPGIVQVIDFSSGTGRAFVVMEYVDGRPLSAIIAESGILPVDRVARIIDSVAGGLAAAHAQGLAHGHLSPDKIFVLPSRDRAEKTKIVGFGLGEEVSVIREMTELTPYTAPEQETSEADARSDQFALAAIAYEMLTGVPPFDESTARLEPPSIRDYAPEVNVIVEDVIRRALAPAPDGRWADVTTFAQRLREAGDVGTLEEKTRVTMTPSFEKPDDDEPITVSTTLSKLAATPVAAMAATPAPQQPTTTASTPTTTPPRSMAATAKMERPVPSEGSVIVSPPTSTSTSTSTSTAVEVDLRTPGLRTTPGPRRPGLRALLASGTLHTPRPATPGAIGVSLPPPLQKPRPSPTLLGLAPPIGRRSRRRSRRRCIRGSPAILPCARWGPARPGR